MRKLLVVLACVLLPAQAWAQRGDAFGARASATLGAMFTTAGNFGPPPFAADPFTCDATTIRTTYYNTTANTIKLCNGSVWQTLGLAGGAAGGVTSGNANAGCTASTLIWNDASGNIACGPTATISANTRIGLASGAVGAPILGPSGAATTGIWFRAGAAISFAQTGNNQFEINTSLIEMSRDAQLLWTGTANDAGTAADTTLYRVAAGIFSAGTTTNNGLGWFQNGGEGTLNGNYTNATAALSATNLSRTLISGRTYTFDVYLYVSESTAAEGWQIAFDGGAVTITNFVVNCFSTNETGGAVTLANATSAALATVINATTTTTTGVQLIECHGSIVPSSSATFIIRAAQNTHSTGTLTIKRGSSLAMRDSPAL